MKKYNENAGYTLIQVLSVLLLIGLLLSTIIVGYQHISRMIKDQGGVNHARNTSNDLYLNASEFKELEYVYTASTDSNNSVRYIPNDIFQVSKTRYVKCFFYEECQ